jgi:hypothetical protein
MVSSDAAQGVRMPRMTRTGMTKTTMNFPERELQDLKELAGSQHISVTDLVRRAVVLERILQNVVREGGKLLVEDANKVIKELIIR